MAIDFDKLTWKPDDRCDVCSRDLPAGVRGFIGTSPGVHLFVVAWPDETGVQRFDGAVTMLWEGVVRRLTPEEAKRCSALALAVGEVKRDACKE